MRGRGLVITGTLLGLVGLALLLVESIRVLGGSTLGGLSKVALYVGLALVVVGAVLLVVTVLTETAEDDTDDSGTGDDDPEQLAAAAIAPQPDAHADSA